MRALIFLLLAASVHCRVAQSDAARDCSSIYAKLPKGKPIAPKIADLPSAAGEEDFQSVCLLLKAGVAANKKDL
jgi:hypothetical protein